MKKGLLALLAIAVALPIGHLVYDRYHVPEAPVDTDAWRLRAETIARARVLMPDAPQQPAEQPFVASDIDCRYDPEPTSGTTPKFDCVLPSGETIKVKYGLNPEIAGEAAATRLLTALGFGTDRMSIVRRVRCYGCPRSPYRSRQIAEWFFVAGMLDHFLDYSQYADFANAAVERKFDARAFEVHDHRGWTWYELDAVDAAKGGASRAELDAFRLMAVFLAHWDNKSPNQRLVCLGDRGPDGPDPCAMPLLMIQDLGATFGPRKVDYLGWKHAPLWRDETGCMVSMAHLPYRGATFHDVDISEEGRAWVASKLTAFTSDEIARLFLSSNFPDPETGQVGGTNVQPWVQVFQDKVGAITRRSCAD
ncbi:MAG: hypothetical protein WD690_14320 [Vicinamibacterales bacterium]